MKVYGLRVAVIALSFLFGILFFFGVSQYYNIYNIEKPLGEKIDELVDVQKYVIDKQGDTFVVTVIINETADLGKSYRELYESVNEIVRGRDFRITLQDNRNEELSGLYYRCQYIIYEAIARGNFNEMAERVTKESLGIGAEAKIFIDEENVYLHLAKDGRYLNNVVPRGTRGGELVD